MALTFYAESLMATVEVKCRYCNRTDDVKKYDKVAVVISLSKRHESVDY